MRYKSLFRIITPVLMACVAFFSVQVGAVNKSFYPGKIWPDDKGVHINAHESPEHTEGYEGFYHLIGVNGTVEQTTVSYIIRDHDRSKFENRKTEVEHLVRKINSEFGEGTATLELKDQYYNMLTILMN